MIHKLKYGEKRLNFNTNEKSEVLNIIEPERTVDLMHFTTSLKLLVNPPEKKSAKIAIVVSDKTRLCGYTNYLPALLNVLESKGVKKENINIYIAYGTHPRQSEDECLRSYGRIYHDYKFIHHDCNDMQVFAELGKTQRGTPVRIRKDILETGMIIAFGAISHHYFAGFGGGRKLLFPGLGERQAIYHNHSLFLDRNTRLLATQCQSGVLIDNPISEDLLEINAMLPSYLSIHGILNSKGEVCQFKFGTTYNDFLDACNIHDQHFRINTDKQYDFVIASAGGYPKDINFIQSHKAVHNAAAFVKDGGSLLVLAECRDGIGTNSFLPVFKEGDWDTTFNKLLDHYEGNGGTALAMMTKTKRINIYMLTELDEPTCSLIGVKKLDFQKAKELTGSAKGSFAVINNASMLIK